MLARLIVFCSLTLLMGHAHAEEPKALVSKKEKVSYSIGMDIGMNLTRQEIDVDADALATGIRDVLSGGQTQLTPEEVQQVLTEFQQELMAKAEERSKMLGEKNKLEGTAFLAANKKKKGIVTLPSGLQYQVQTKGTGPVPQATDTVTTHYRGTLIDGTEFDSSIARGEPATFPVNGVIKGWQEALQLMKVGSKWRVFVPAELAYGERGAGGVIGPNATLIFDVELLSIGKDETE
jgi:FKBP-type peptidyl-prolyl cis-trans isomerase FklB